MTKYAPLVYLSSLDAYRPSDIAAQLANTQPEVNFTVVDGAGSPLTLNNLNSLNELGGADVYLTSEDDVEANPAWLLGQSPNGDGKTDDAVTCAIIVNDHGAGLVDVFYMYFYAYNFGGVYFGLNVGNHVGDWEHNMIRFQSGTPQALWYSQHAEGQAFKYDVLEKQGDRVCPSPSSPQHSTLMNTTANSLLGKRHARRLRHVRNARPYSPQHRSSQWSAARHHRPRRPLGSYAKRLLLRLRRQNKHIHGLRRQLASRLALLQRPLGR